MIRFSGEAGITHLGHHAKICLLGVTCSKCSDPNISSSKIILLVNKHQAPGTDFRLRSGIKSKHSDTKMLGISKGKSIIIGYISIQLNLILALISKPN